MLFIGGAVQDRGDTLVIGSGLVLGQDVDGLPTIDLPGTVVHTGVANVFTEMQTFNVVGTAIYLPAGYLLSEGAGVGARIFAGQVTGDAVNRWRVNVDGRQEWSDGVLAADVSIERRYAGVLRISNALAGASKVSARLDLGTLGFWGILNGDIDARLFRTGAGVVSLDNGASGAADFLLTGRLRFGLDTTAGGFDAQIFRNASNGVVIRGAATGTLYEFALQRSAGNVLIAIPAGVNEILISGARFNSNIYFDRAAGTNRQIVGMTAGLSRWSLILGNTVAEAGANAGSDFSISRFNDDGSGIGQVIYITRSTGLVQLSQGLNVTGVIWTQGGINVSAGSFYQHSAQQVVGPRRTGWTAPTGIKTRTTFDPATATLPQGLERLAAVIEDLMTHGLIGA